MNESQSVVPMWLPIKTVCQLTSLSRSTLVREIRCGSAKSIKVGRRVLVSVSYLEGLQAKANKGVEA